MSQLPEGVTEHTTDTARIRMRYTEAGSPDGIPVVLVHGNLSTCRFMDDQLAVCPDTHRFIAPDMRGFGGSEKVAIDATRGLRDWSEDVVALLDALEITQPTHLAGWSTGGGAIMQLLIDHPDRVASLTLIDPVSPYGFGGTHRDGRLATSDGAGTGGGAGNPDFITQLREHNTGTDSPFAIRNIMRGSYWSESFTMEPEREDLLVAEVLESLVGDGGYPGDSTPSENWPGFAPGKTGILNALAPTNLDTSGIVDVASKPPIQWHRGSADAVIADGSPWDLATLGQQGVVPGWPGAQDSPVQEMVGQTRDVLDAYAAAGGQYEEIVHEGSGHGPHIDDTDNFNAKFLEFVSQ